MDDTCSAAAFTGSAARCAYRAIVWTCVCPSSLPTIGSPWPAATAAEAKRVAQVVNAGVLEPGASAGALQRCKSDRRESDSLPVMIA